MAIKTVGDIFQDYDFGKFLPFDIFDVLQKFAIFSSMMPKFSNKKGRETKSN